MPDLGWFHPLVVHFVVALIVVGVLLRVAALGLAVSWLPMAASLLIALGTGASLLAVRSGIDAHGPVERIPGARDAVVEHEEWGERAKNAFLILLVVDVAATALVLRRPAAGRMASILAALLGVVAVGTLYKAAGAGGDLVYSYAGGVGIRTGAPEDVNRLLIAAAYQHAALDRKSGRPSDAAALLDMVADRFPEHLELQLARIESMVDDRRSPQTALERLDAIHLPTADTRLRIRAGLLRARALRAAGETNAARQVLETLKAEFPGSPQIQRGLNDLASPRP